MLITTVGKCQWCEAHKQKLVLCCEAKDGELRIAWLCEKCQEKLKINSDALNKENNNE